MPDSVLLLDPSVVSSAGSEPTVLLRPVQIFAIPRSQRYYWTAAWQAGEGETLRAYERGECIQFSSGREAAAWLLSEEGEDRDEEQTSDGD